MTVERRRVWIGVVGALLLNAAGCGGTPPGTLVGESAHFRLFVDPALTPPAGLAGMNGLAALETEWTDVHTMLEMPDGKVTYYWLTQDHVFDACGSVDEGACIDEGSLQIVSPTLPNPHELNHAYAYLRKQRRPIPFLAEGIAEAISCEYGTPTTVDDVHWPAVVASLSSWREVYTQGGAFVRHLIRRFGIAAFLDYYEQSPEQRDPALFGANFASFWGLDINDVWEAIHASPTNTVSAGDAKICPCSLPALAPDSPLVNDAARAPYWTIPPLSTGETVALTAAATERVHVQDCAGVRSPMTGQGILARLDAAHTPRYVLGPLENASVGPYLADQCAVAVPYTITPAFQSDAGLEIAIASPPTGSATIYLRLTTSFPFPIRAGDFAEICNSCAFDQGACQPLAGASLQQAPATFWGRTTLYTSVADPNADVVVSDIGIRP